MSETDTFLSLYVDDIINLLRCSSVSDTKIHFKSIWHYASIENKQNFEHNTVNNMYCQIPAKIYVKLMPTLRKKIKNQRDSDFYF